MLDLIIFNFNCFFFFVFFTALIYRLYGLRAITRSKFLVRLIVFYQGPYPCIERYYI